jgi:hypothetical protein
MNRCPDAERKVLAIWILTDCGSFLPVGGCFGRRKGRGPLNNQQSVKTPTPISFRTKPRFSATNVRDVNMSDAYLIVLEIDQKVLKLMETRPETPLRIFSISSTSKPLDSTRDFSGDCESQSWIHYAH